jgi:hypothetical protein
MLNEIREIRATLAKKLNRSVALSEAAFHWQRERWEPTVRALGPVLERYEDRAERYCQVLEHKWFLSEQAQEDVGLEKALEDYLATIKGAPGTVAPGPPDGSAPKGSP